MVQILVNYPCAVLTICFIIILTQPSLKPAFITRKITFKDASLYSLNSTLHFLMTCAEN